MTSLMKGSVPVLSCCLLHSSSRIASESTFLELGLVFNELDLLFFSVSSLSRLFEVVDVFYRVCICSA